MNIDYASKDAQLQSEAFQALSAEVRKYSQKLDKFAEAQRITFVEDIKRLKTKIEALDKAIKEYAPTFLSDQHITHCAFPDKKMPCVPQNAPLPFEVDCD